MNTPTLPTSRHGHDNPGSAATAAAGEPADQGDTLPAVERSAATAHAAIDQTAAKAGPVQDKVQDMTLLSDPWLCDARQQVRRHPLTSVAFGLLAGWVIAKVGGNPRQTD